MLRVVSARVIVSSVIAVMDARYSPDVHLSEDELEFSASGLGARGQNEYHFVLEFFNAINPNESQYRVGEGQVEFNIKKRSPDSWPRLITNSRKPAWLKIDFEKWKPDADDEESEEMQDNPNGYKEFFDNYKSEKQLSGRNFTSHIQNFRKFYLCLYNLFHTFGYGFILVALIMSYSKQGPESMKNAYQYVGWCMKLSQSLQVMDIVHRLLKYTKGSLKETVMQVGGRFIMLFVMIESEPRIQDKPVVFVLYPYYMLRIYKYELSILTWLRYTIWIPLYPLGFLCEGAIILKNIPYFEETKKFTCYVLMNYMYYQRKKKLGYTPRFEDTFSIFNSWYMGFTLSILRPHTIASYSVWSLEVYVPWTITNKF
uniref:Very-long-chain (3R)-3-hydroxyacyl-CoA dehydratase n=1 Tax=Strigamia maritima TaxID=126957 RepID=T1IUT0_STRMM